MAISAMTAFFVCSCINDSDEPAWSLSVGDVLPVFSVLTSEGQTVSTENLRGHWGVIVFFNTSCSDCRRELPELQKAYVQLKDRKDVVFACIAREEDAESIAAYWMDNALTMPRSAQPNRSVYNLFANSGIPRTYVINPSGYISATFAPEDRLTSNMLLDCLPVQ